LKEVLPSPKAPERLSRGTIEFSIKPLKKLIYVFSELSAGILVLGATVNVIFVPSTV